MPNMVKGKNEEADDDKWGRSGFDIQINQFYYKLYLYQNNVCTPHENTVRIVTYYKQSVGHHGTSLSVAYHKLCVITCIP